MVYPGGGVGDITIRKPYLPAQSLHVDVGRKEPLNTVLCPPSRHRLGARTNGLTLHHHEGTFCTMGAFFRIRGVAVCAGPGGWPVPPASRTLNPALREHLTGHRASRRL